MQQTGDISFPCIVSQFAEPASRTHRILEDLRDVGLVGRKVDFLYGSTGICFSSVKITAP